MYIFFDIETLSTNKNAMVLSAGFVVVDLVNPKHTEFLDIVKSGIEIKFDVKQQKHRHVSKSTLDWWSQQGTEAQKVLCPSEYDIRVEDFYKSLEPLGYVRKAFWFCKGPHFDAAIMESLFEDFKMKAPWGYSKMRDTRTWLECSTDTTMPYDRPDGFINHNCVHDAAFDAWQFIKVLHDK